MSTRSCAARWCAFVAACALVAPPALAQDASPAPAATASPSGPYQSAVARIAADAPEAMRRQHAPGMALALTDRNGTIAVLTFGSANLEKNEPVTQATRFGIGSITKSMTALALLQARDRGRFDLHAPVTRYLPWFSVRTHWRALTGHDLLTHTSGLPDGGLGYGAPFDVALLRELATGFAPGTHWSYSNVGYETLGEIVAAIDRGSWSNVVRDGVLTRVGMTSSSTDWTFATLASAATGYLPREDDRLPDPRAWLLAPVPLAEFTNAAGSVLSTPGDMAKYARMLLRGGIADDGRRVVSAAAYALLTSPATKAGTGGVPGLYASYAYGLAVHTLDGDRVVGHTGGTTPYTACLEADLTTGFAAVALTNVGYVAPRPCPIVEHALRTLRAASKGKPLPALPAEHDPAQVNAARSYAGTYRSAGGAAPITVVAPARDRLALLVDATQLPLLPAGGGLFFTDDARFRLSGLRFIADAKTHRAYQLVAAGRWYTTAAYRGPTSFPHPAAWDAYAGYYRYPGAHPYDPSLRVQLVKGALAFDDGTPLVSLGDGSFRAGEESWSPERVRFDTVIGGRAQRLLYSGVALYRVTTP
jgi:CubicO group peptidase (beta-lactamase class C family)